MPDRGFAFVLKGKGYLGWRKESATKTLTHARKAKTEKEESVQSFKEDTWPKVYWQFFLYYVHIYNIIGEQFKRKNSKKNYMYLQIRCQSLSVISMEIEGSVKLSENIHNIWIAWKPAVSSQTRYRTRRTIVPKFLKNAMKTLLAFCVFYNGGIIICQY